MVIVDGLMLVRPINEYLLLINILVVGYPEGLMSAMRNFIAQEPNANSQMGFLMGSITSSRSSPNDTRHQPDAGGFSSSHNNTN